MIESYIETCLMTKKPTKTMASQQIQEIALLPKIDHLKGRTMFYWNHLSNEGKRIGLQLRVAKSKA